jgi:hypothetical protein
LELEDRELAADALTLLYRSMAESLKRLFDLAEYDQFHELHKNFLELLRYWEIYPHEKTARRMLADPQRWSATAEDLTRCEQALELHALKAKLENLRRTYRISVLAWMIRSFENNPMDERFSAFILRELPGLGSPSAVVEAAGGAMSPDETVLSRWLLFEQAGRGVTRIDTDLYVLKTLLLYLFLRSDITEIPPALWMGEERISRAKELTDLLGQSTRCMKLVNVSEDDALGRASNIKTLLDQAAEAQVILAERALIAQSLDESKVTEFQQAVVDGWRQSRLVPGLEQLGLIESNERPLEDFGMTRFYRQPWLESKGVFVTPTNWALPGNFGKDIGQELAEDELDTILSSIVRLAPKFRGKGTVTERVRQMLGALRSSRYKPSVILVPIDWRLNRALNLPDWREPDSREDPLGRYIQGHIDDLPVLQWPRVPRDRIYAADLSAFVLIEEAIDQTGAVSPPTVSVEAIDEAGAADITSNWEPESDPDKEAARRRRLLTKVVVDVDRPYRTTVIDDSAARSVWIPPSARDVDE